MQQLCSFAPKDKKISNKLLFLDREDILGISGSSIIGCRIVMLVCSGSVTIKVSGKECTLHAHTYLDILEGTRFQFCSATPDAELHCIVTTRDFIMQVLEGIVPGPNNYMFKIMINPTILLDEAATATMLRQFELIEGILSDVNHFQREELVMIYFRSFSLELGNILINRDDWHMPEQTFSKRDMVIANFMDLVWKNFRDNREISFYAKELCMSSKHLSRLVKEATGKTPHEIIAGEVIGLAMQLLRNEGLLIQQISDILHFSDQAAFSKFFKKYLKVSPAEYRKSL